MLQLLNLAIGLSFVYLLVSLIVTALNEFILCLPKLDKRADFLKEGLTQLLGNRLAYAARGTGDDGHLAGQVEQ